ncbi:MAG TPA: tripartite tricarboxylate transporter substrate binding protein [Pseudolabrys sp.]|nr:tripartite tricarboxylate transporter substrate binding protein [Pseudolabrys sp.]
MKRFVAALAVLAAATCATAASADDYPSRPIRVLTTSSAGGVSDIFMRVLGDAMRPHMNNQPFIIENKPGASGGIAAHACQDATPDGYTLCLINVDVVAYNQYLFKQIPYDPDKLTPIVNLFHLIQVLVVNNGLNVKNVDELVARSKEKKGTLSYLTASIPCYVYMESLKREKGADWVRVPFKGGGEATNALLSGSTPIGLYGLGNVMGQIRAGKLAPLALVNNIRTPLLPNTPTLADTGYKGAPSQTWYGLFAPPGTPKAIVDKVNAEVRRAFQDKDFVQKYVIERGQVPAINSPEEFAAEIKADRIAGAQVAKESGLPLR